MNRDHLTMTDDEFLAHWSERRAQLERVYRWTWLYAVPLLLSELAGIGALSLVTPAPVWLCALAGGAAGVAATKAGIALAWRREGGKPDYLRRPLKEDQ